MGKNYCFVNSSQKWRVSKRINKKQVIFGYYDSEETAQQIVEKLKEVNWDKNKLSSIQKELGLSKNRVIGEPKYYNKDDKGWKVSKRIKGKRITFGYFNTEKEARLVVSELKKVDWDKKELSAICEKLGIENKVKNIIFIKQTGLWQVRHNHILYGGYESEEDAELIVTEMRKVGWDKSQLKRVLDEYGINAHIRCDEPKYYYFRKDRGVWVVKIRKNYLGSFVTEEEAKRFVEKNKHKYSN